MTIRKMNLESVTWDDVADTATLTLRDPELSVGPRPGEAGTAWWPGSSASVTITVPIRRSAQVTNPIGILVTHAADDSLVFTKYEQVNGVWLDRGRVNRDWTPYTG